MCDEKPLISLRNVNCRYQVGVQDLHVLKHVTLDILRGQSCVIMGTSGSGKSTLLNILGLLGRPSSGKVYFSGCDIQNASSDELALIRNKEIGFVFQSFNLLPRLTAWENVALPLSYRGIPRHKARQYAMTQLQKVGLADRATHRPSELSGGQCQRVAIARALIGSPSLILADEPTGNLDKQTAIDILNWLLKLNREKFVTLILVTHDTSLSEYFDRQLKINQGEMQEVLINREKNHV